MPDTTRRPTVIAHRGASGHAPENSLAAFAAARRLGADGVELDVHATADHGLVVHHDPVLPGLGAIADLPVAAVTGAMLADGSPLPTLAQALAALRGLDAWIELKALPPAADAALLAVLDAGPEPSRYRLHAFDHRIVCRLAAQVAYPIGLLQASYPLDPVACLRGTGAVALWQEAHLIDAALVAAAAEAGAGVVAWTVNDADDARRLAALGVAGLCGNHPERLRVP